MGSNEADNTSWCPKALRSRGTRCFPVPEKRGYTINMQISRRLGWLRASNTSMSSARRIWVSSERVSNTASISRLTAEMILQGGLILLSGGNDVANGDVADASLGD